jgi:hypothetical protein
MRTKAGQPENSVPALPTLNTRAHRILEAGDYAAQHDADYQPGLAADDRAAAPRKLRRTNLAPRVWSRGTPGVPSVPGQNQIGLHESAWKEGELA